jgi:hypothetical protein
VTSEMAMQLASGPEEGYGSHGRGGGRSGGAGASRPMSYYGGQGGQQGFMGSRQRSKSVADVRQFTRDGRPILHFGKSSSKLQMHYVLTSFSPRTIHVSSCNSRGVEFC